MNQNNPLAKTSPPPAREGVETPFLHCSTPIPTFPLAGGRNWFALFLLLCGTAQAAPFADGDAKAGKKLIDQYKCNSCHMAKMGGDGNSIFTRPDHKVTSPEKMISQIKMCSGNVGANLSAQEQQDLAAYLNRQYYQFK